MTSTPINAWDVVASWDGRPYCARGSCAMVRRSRREVPLRYVDRDLMGRA